MRKPTALPQTGTFHSPIATFQPKMNRSAWRRATNANIELVTRTKAPCFIDRVSSVFGRPGRPEAVELDDAHPQSLLRSSHDELIFDRGPQRLERRHHEALPEPPLLRRAQVRIAHYAGDGLAPHDAVRADRLRQHLERADLHDRDAERVEFLRERGAAAVARPSGGR